ncbi:hypothetical protein BDZ45DRAFT_746082 [Acephala macrosclerotiorum]|nr:hypothetical protein BDZ45DRAFT_746082 [Acephala macrosclerotiorum]
MAKVRSARRRTSISKSPRILRLDLVTCQSQNFNLLDLPPEMIDEIASFLPLRAIACLALCNKALHQAFSKQHEKCWKACPQRIECTKSRYSERKAYTGTPQGPESESASLYRYHVARRTIMNAMNASVSTVVSV